MSIYNDMGLPQPEHPEEALARGWRERVARQQAQEQAREAETQRKEQARQNTVAMLNELLNSNSKETNE